MKRKLLVIAGIVPALLLRAHLGAAEVPATCGTSHALDKYKLLRRLSMDLRNRPPSMEEYAALERVDTVPDEVIASFLASDDYRRAMRRHHENQLWPNISNVKIGSGDNDVALEDTGVGRLTIKAHANVFRRERLAVCDDTVQVDFDPAYPKDFRPTKTRRDGSAEYEGYRMVHPYWAPDTTIKVCAFDAQETLTTTYQGATVRCGTREGGAAKECGCGPNLIFCYGPKNTVASIVTQALRDQLGRQVDKVTTGKAPYTDLILAQTVDEDGPIAHWRKYLAPQMQAGNFGTTYNVPMPSEAVADIPFAEVDTWKPVARSAQHAGVLTMPAYLLRFQTERSRANRFRVAFMGQYFVPAAKLEPQEGCSNDSPDLTKRCNCQYCHQTLEPLASHFGAFSEAGSGFLGDAARFPVQRPECVGSKKGDCERFYVTRADAPRPGFLNAFQFEGAHPEYAENFAQGPRKLAEAVVKDGTFARSVIRSLYARLMKRDMHVEGDKSEDAPLLAQLAGELAAGGYSYPALVKRMVSLPEYRRVR